MSENVKRLANEIKVKIKGTGASRGVMLGGGGAVALIFAWTFLRRVRRSSLLSGIYVLINMTVIITKDNIAAKLVRSPL